MSLPPLPTTILAIPINWVQRMGQTLRHDEKVLQIVWWGGGGGQKQARVGNGQKKTPGALILPLTWMHLLSVVVSGLGPYPLDRSKPLELRVREGSPGQEKQLWPSMY